MKIAFVILNYNSHQKLERCISSIIQKSDCINDIIIVDNNSTHSPIPTVRFIASKLNLKLSLIETTDKKAQIPDNSNTQNRLFLLLNKDNKGYSAGNNIGIKFSIQLGHKFTFILNPDTELIGGSVKQAIKNLSDDTSFTLLSPAIYNASYKIEELPLYEYDSIVINFLRLLFPKIGKQKLKKVHGKNYYLIQKIHGCCFVLKNSNMQKTGLLDEEIFLSSEETAIYYRLKKYNFKTLYYPDLKVAHLHNDSNIFEDELKHYKLFINSRKYIFSNYLHWNPLIVELWVKAAYMRKIISTRIKYLIKKNKIGQ